MLRKICFSLGALGAFNSVVWACPQCHPLVQAGIYTPDFAPTLGILMLPLALILGLALAVYRT